MAEKKLDTATIIKWVITIAIPLIVYLIPCTEVYTMPIKKFFVIVLFSILLMAFELLGFMAVALFIPFAFIVTKLAAPAQVFAPWTQPTVWLITGSLLLGVILDESGLVKRLAYWGFAKAGGSMTAILWVIFALGFVLAYSAPGNGALFIIFGYSICKALDIKPMSNAAVLMFFVCYIAGNALSIMLSYDGMFDAALSQLTAFAAGSEKFAPVVALQQFDFNVTYLDYVYHNAIMIPCAILLIIAALIILKPEKEYTERFNRAYFEEEYRKLGPWNIIEIKGAIVVILMFILLCTQKIHGMAVYLCIMVPCIFAMFPFMGFGGASLLRKVDYTTSFFVTGTMAVGTVGNMVGATAILTSILMPLLSGANHMVTCGLAFVIGYVANLILTPMAGVAMLSGPIGQIVATIGDYPVPVMYSLINGLNNALLPYEGALYVFMFSFGYMNTKQFIKIFTVRTLIVLVWVLIACVPYWNAIGLFNGLVPWPF